MGARCFDKDRSDRGLTVWPVPRQLHFMEGPKPSPDRKSLWQALRSTEAGFGGRLLLPLAVSSVVSGVLFILWFIISMIIHLSSNRGGRFEMVGDEDVCILVICVLAGLIYVAFLFVTFPWVLIFKLIRSFWFWGAVVATVLSSIVTVVLCVVADEWIRGEEGCPGFLGESELPAWHPEQ